MAAEQLQVLALGVAVLIVFASGFRLSRAGRPYSPLLLNVHKLVDLAAAIYLVIIVHRANSAKPLAIAEWVVVGLAALLLVGLFATGGVASGSDKSPQWVLRLHRVLPWLALACAGTATYVTMAT